MQTSNRQMIEQNFYSLFSPSFIMGVLLTWLILLYLPANLLLSDNYMIRLEHYSGYLIAFIMLMYFTVSDTYAGKYPLSAAIIYGVMPHVIIGGINYLAVNSIAMKITVLTMIVYLGILVCLSIKRYGIKSQVNLQYIKYLCIQFIKVFCLICSVLIILLSIHTYQTTKITLHDAYDISEAETNIINNQMLRHDFNNKYFFVLTDDEKYSILYYFLEIEKEHLGIQDVEIKIVYNDSITRGSYSPNKRLVAINLKNRKQVKNVLKTLLHECYHVYQNDVDAYLTGVNIDTNLMFLRDIKYWRSEKINRQCYYPKGGSKEQYLQYLGSSKEQTARNYATKRLNYYAKLFDGFN